MSAHVEGDSLIVAASAGEANLLTLQRHPTQAGTYLIADPGAAIDAGAGCTGAPLGRVAICSVAAALPEHDYSPSLSLSLGDRGDVAKVDGGFFLVQVDAGSGSDRLDLPSFGWTGGARVELGGGADALNLQGSASTDVQVHAGGGADTIDASSQDGGAYHGEGGNDSITAAGWVTGGDGADTLIGTGQATGHYFGDAGDDSIDTADTNPDVVDCGLGADELVRDELDGFSACETVG